MAGFYVHGPTLTYVTDPGLDLTRQQRVIAAFSRCAADQMLRVAFRLPEASEDAVELLFTWYLNLVESEGLSEVMLPPLIHNRPALAARYGDAALWMPARAIHTAQAAAYSVHTVAEASDAIAAGAEEVICGHIFASESHPGEPGHGTSRLQQIASAIRTDINTPVVTAIGGIDEHTVGEIGRARIFNVAAIRAISRSPDIARTLEAIRRNWITALIDEDLNDPEPLAFDRSWGIWRRWEAGSRM